MRIYRTHGAMPAHVIVKRTSPPIIYWIAKIQEFPGPMMTKTDIMGYRGRGGDKGGHSMLKVVAGAIAGAMVASGLFLVIATISLGTGHLQILPACQYEDGNPNGKPCVWTDPDTGNTYVLDGSEYRN